MSKLEMVYGIHAVTSLLSHHGESVVQLFLQADRKDKKDKRFQEILDSARRAGIPIIECSRAELDEKCTEVHQGVLALSRPSIPEKHEKDLDALLDNLNHPPFLLILDGVTDPHNLGACLRSAEAAGVDAVIVTKDKSAQLSPTVRKVACGAAEIVPFISVTNLVRTLQSLQQRGIWTFGAAGEAAQSVYQADLKGPLALVLGSEGKGLRRLTRENCDNLIAIPMAGEVSSLNVSVSTGICLFEAVRQRNV
jgi:23S rRNA (guanosine2251-2'-O)-methyltransferase